MGFWACCQVELAESTEDWPIMPPTRGGQKKEAMKKKQDNDLQSLEGTMCASGKLQNRHLQHPSLGKVSLTFASKKSYMCTTRPQVDQPALLAQFTESQVGQDHGPLLLSLASTVVKEGLERDYIKALKDAVLELHKR